ncbi:MAG: FG-GAP-like repeat-containing protein [Alkalispirochaeta sp.]
MSQERKSRVLRWIALVGVITFVFATIACQDPIGANSETDDDVNETDDVQDAEDTDADDSNQDITIALSSEDDSGISDSDGITNKTSGLTLTGAAIEGAAIEVVSSGSVLGSTDAADDGAWRVDVDLVEGTHEITARLLDESGSTVGESETLTIRVDTTPPPDSPRLLRPRIGLNTGADLTPEFRWSPRPSEETIEIQLSDSPTTMPYSWDGLQGTSFRPQQELEVSQSAPVGKRYWIRIRAVDAAGNPGPWDNEQPGAPTRYVNVGRFDGDFNGDGHADILVGDYYYATTTGENRGRAYLFHGAERGSFDTTADYIVEGKAGGSGSTSGRLGLRLGFVGDVNADGYQDFVVSAISWGATEEGEAYLFLGGDSQSGTVSASTADLVITNPTASSSPTIGRFGWGISGAGDVNADGYADFLLGAYRGSTSSQSGGYPSYVALYLGGSTPDASPDAEMEAADSGSYTSNYVTEHFAIHHGPAGDLNGDGYADFVIGRPLWDAGQLSSAGRAEVYFGGETIASSPTPDRTFEGSAANEFVGVAAYGAGDLNGDGLDDLLVGTHIDEVWLYLGAADFNPASPDVTFVAPGDIDDGRRFGNTLAPIGDFNGDGIDDLVIGAQSYEGTSSLFGRAAIYYGSETFGSSVTGYDRSATGVAQESHLASALGSPGDVDGDGKNDLLIGEWGRSKARFLFGTDGALATDYNLDPGSPVDRRFGMGIGRGW